MEYDRDALILEHLKLADNIALKEWRTATHALDKAEMQSLAYLGLVSAADRWPDYCTEKEYDPGALQYFKVFAALRIRGTIRDFIRKEDWATRTLRTKSKLLKQAGQDDGISVQELSSRTGLSVREIDKVSAKLAARPVSLDAYRNTQDSQHDMSSHASNDLADSVDTEGAAFANAMNAVFLKCFESLPNENKLVIVLHYYSKLPFRSISDLLDFTEGYVSTLHRQSVLQIRDAMQLAASERN